MVLKVFDDFPAVLHIELGAGCGNFGLVYFPDCFLSDAESNNFLRSVCPSPTTFIDKLQCSAHEIPCQESRFEKVVMANPFNYGFFNSTQSEILFYELFRVLKPGGEAIVIANKSNPWGAYGSIADQLVRCTNGNELFSIQYTTIDQDIDFPGYLFLNSNRISKVRPNQKTVLTCLK